MQLSSTKEAVTETQTPSGEGAEGMSREARGSRGVPFAWQIVFGACLVVAVCLTAAASNENPYPGRYYLTSVLSGKCLEVAGWDNQEFVADKQGANVRQWDYVGGGNQLWEFSPLGGSQFIIYNVYSGMCLEVAGWDNGRFVALDQGANVRQWEYVGGGNQHWTIEALSDDRFAIFNAYSGMCLEVAGWDDGEYVVEDQGANVRQWEYLETDNQRWTMTLVP